MKFKIQNSKFKIAIIVFIMALFSSVFVQAVQADAVTDNALNFLKSKQDATGKITTGFSAPSQWSAIAFTINGVDIATVKNADTSLFDFLKTDMPASGSAATDWETRILAIVAINYDPTNFNGTNYVSNLELAYNANQLGDTCSLNDDIFGLLALVASGDAATAQIKQDTLQFLISKQDPTDGGFGFSAPGCAFYGTSADMTGAAVQALVAARDHGMTAAGLDEAITKAKNYLLANQGADGGFGYFGSSDTDTTGWVLMALNVLEMKDSTQAQSAKAYLLSQQSATDGGITAFDYGSSTFVSNASTTAQALIALSGESWIITIYDSVTAKQTTVTASVTSTPTPTVTPTTTPTPTTGSGPTATPTPTPGSSSSSSPTSTPTPTPRPEADQPLAETPTSTVTLARVLDGPLAPEETAYKSDEEIMEEITGTPTPAVLGTSEKKDDTASNYLVSAWIFGGLGVAFIFINLAKQFIIKK